MAAPQVAAAQPDIAVRGLTMAFGDFVPYQDEYSNEFLNSWSVPHNLHLPLLTAPFGGSMTQW